MLLKPSLSGWLGEPCPVVTTVPRAVQPGNVCPSQKVNKVRLVAKRDAMSHAVN